MIARIERWLLARRIEAARSRLEDMMQANRAKAAGYVRYRRAGKLGWARRRGA